VIPKGELCKLVAGSARGALVGETAPTLRAYSFAVDPESSRIRLRAHYTVKPDEDEIDRIQVVDTEILADFPPPFVTETDWEVVPFGTEPNFLPDGVAFMRDEQSK
jgi:hypothetical protein